MPGRKPLFDRKFGDAFVLGLPKGPGVYEVLDASGAVVYVGKARNLRRRLQQYRNARRRKKHLKMREIVAAACSIRVTPCATDLEALLLENKLIQTLRPHFNVAGAFSFLYPCIGIRRSERNLHLCYTTSPGEFPMFSFFGAYRSREIGKAAFLALLDTLELVGHREPRSRLTAYPKIRFSILAAFRQIGDEWLPSLERFLRGESRDFLESSVLALLEKPFARRHAAETQEKLDAMARFFEFEAKALRNARADLGITSPFVPQAERDRLFLIAREARKARRIRRDAGRST